MKPISESSKESEIKSVWANGEYIIGPIEAVSPPTGESPYWKIRFKGGDILWVTGQVVVKQGPKT